MPKLPKKHAKEVQETESSSFEPLPPGVYPFRLLSVEVSDTKGASGFHYWKAEFECDHSEYRNRKAFVNLSLSPKAAFKMKEFFDAFGVSADTDTDELLGQQVNLQLGITTIQSGSRQGETTNEVIRIKPYDEAEADWGDDDDDDDDDDEDEPF